MRGFLYFIPHGNPGLSAAGSPLARPDPAVCGIGHALTVARMTFLPMGAAGPGGTGGTLCCDSRLEGFEPGYSADPAVQRWQAAEGGTWFVGVQIGHEPQPEDLWRGEDALGGHPVKLGDGGEWVVPVARAIQGASSLPLRLGLAPDGTLVFGPIQRYAAIAADAEKVWRALRAGLGFDSDPAGPPEMSVSEGFRIACDALSLNYRVTRWELALLGVVTTINLVDVLSELVDRRSLREVSAALAAAAKKKAPATTPGGSSIGSGPAAAPPGTGPPGPTSPGSPPKTMSSNTPATPV